MSITRAARAVRQMGGFAGGTSRLARPPMVLEDADVRPQDAVTPTSGEYWIGLHGRDYLHGFAGHMELDASSETGATGDIYVSGALIHLPAGVTIDYAECIAESDFPMQPWTAGLVVYDTSMGVQYDDLFTNTDPGSGGIYSSIEPAFTVPDEGWIGMYLANNAGFRWRQYDWADLDPVVYWIYVMWST